MSKARSLQEGADVFENLASLCGNVSGRHLTGRRIEGHLARDEK